MRNKNYNSISICKYWDYILIFIKCLDVHFGEMKSRCSNTLLPRDKFVNKIWRYLARFTSLFDLMAWYLWKETSFVDIISSSLVSRKVLSFGDLPTLLYYKLVSSFLQILSFIRLRPLDLFLPTGNHLPISFVASLYLFSLQVWNLNFLGSLLSSILRICSLQFVLYCVNYF